MEAEEHAVHASQEDADEVEDPDVVALAEVMRGNTHAYMQGEWRREPFPAFPLQVIRQLQVCGGGLEEGRSGLSVCA
jgi:hypothetical protein